ncbi:MAG: NAD(P)/FAD-dependent oxidoreductase [Gemmatimonadetes bacterium]|nr:NAD(P)/FAD-dependent oxidoreductase [Gemmatimonadota bacterium]
MAHLRFDPDPACDVLVAGGGPAGAATAAHLARAGLRVTLLDRQRFPRDKVCGDFVGPAAMVELDALGVTGVPEYRATNVIRHAAVHLNGVELIRQPLPQVEGMPAYGRVIPRMLLDAWLLDAARRAGANLVEGVRVTGFDAGPHGVTVAAERDREPCTFRARLLVGADGSNSVVARTLRGSVPPDEDRIVAVRAYYDGDSGPEDRCDLYFTGESFPGYYWLFPTGGGRANVGVGMVLETLPPTGDHLRGLLLDLVARDPALSARLEGARMEGKVVGWPLTTYDARLPVVGERVMLVGDAAGFINPLNGEGIQYALVSARWAAETVADAVAADDFSVARLKTYAARAERELRYDMALAGLVVHLIRNRHLTPVWLEALKVISSRARVDREYAAVAGGILAGLAPARDALTFRVVGRTLEQAVRSLGMSLAWNALKGPRNLSRLGRGVAGGSAAMVAGVLQDPLALFDWVVGALRQGGELAGQFGAHVLDGGAAPDPPVAFEGEEVRLQIPLDHVHHDLLHQPPVV